MTLDEAWDTLTGAAYETFTTPHLFLTFCVAVVVGAFIGWMLRS